MALLWVVAVGLGIFAFVTLTNRLKRTEASIDLLLSRLDRLEKDEPSTKTPARTARSVSVPATVPRDTVPETSPPRPASATIALTASTPKQSAAVPPLPAPPPAPPPEPGPTLAQRLETAIAGKLPIWVGGLALILSAFFLVRYSIEQGLLGPGVRCVLAALFGLALLAASELTRFLPKVAEDERVAQALAGAGVASLYGTLYMASEMYALISPLVAFALLVMVTMAALGLSLRRGPPTAIMGLIGGFATPYLADTGSGNVTALLVYLGLLMAGLFALALHRGWLWLALAATGGSVVWSVGLMASGAAGLDPELGLFIAGAALAGTLIIPRTGHEDARVRLIPMLAGFVQLLMLAPGIDFALSGWVMYAALSLACVILAWRDARMVHGPLAALALVIVLLAGAFAQDKDLAPWAAIGATLLFGLAGHAFARREGDGRWWSALALGATLGPLLTANIAATDLLFAEQWGHLFALATVPMAALSWRARAEGRQQGMPDWALAGGAIGAAIAASIAFYLWFDPIWLAASLLAVAAALAGWSRSTNDRAISIASMAIVAIAGIVLLGAWAFNSDVPASIFGPDARPVARLVIALIALPGALAALNAWAHRGRLADQPLRCAALALLSALVLALLPSRWHPAILALLAGLALSQPLLRSWLPRFGSEGLVAATATAMLSPLSAFGGIIALSLIGFFEHYSNLPKLVDAMVLLALPAALIGAGYWLGKPALGRTGRILVAAAVGAPLLALLYTLVKQPLAIDHVAQFIRWGFVERAVTTQLLILSGWLLVRRPEHWAKWGLVPISLGFARFIWFDMLLLNPAWGVDQMVGSWPLLNAVTIHGAAMTAWLWFFAQNERFAAKRHWLHYALCVVMFIAVLATVRQASQGMILNRPGVPRLENYGYSLALLGLAMAWLWVGVRESLGWLRLAGLALLTLVTVKVFLIDASALSGLLRVVSFLGLGAALIGIGWAYGRLLRRESAALTNGVSE